MEYAGDSTLYVSTNHGKVSAWDTRHNTCFMHWEADNTEIGGKKYFITVLMKNKFHCNIGIVEGI